ncbi:MAG: hypothetical protein WBY71_03255 [Nitrososphaeraceae archaeon]
MKNKAEREKILDITFASWTYFWNIIYIDDDQTWLVAHYVVASNNCGHTWSEKLSKEGEAAFIKANEYRR